MKENSYLPINKGWVELPMLSWHQSESVINSGKQMTDLDWSQLNMGNSTHLLLMSYVVVTIL